MKQHKWHKEIKAWADGAEIEFRYKDRYLGDEWELVEVLNDFGEEFEYRIKPQFECNTACGHYECLEHQNECKRLIKPQPKEPQYLYVYIGENDGYIFSRFHPSKYSNPECIGKIKLEVEDDI